MKKASPSALFAEERALRSKLHQLLHRAEGLAHGSLVEMKRRCGKLNCRCASDEACKHSSLYLSQTRNGKTRMIYLPQELEETVRRWVGDFRRASELLEAVSREGWRRIAEKKAAARPRPGRAGRRQPAAPNQPS